MERRGHGQLYDRRSRLPAEAGRLGDSAALARNHGVPRSVVRSDSHDARDAPAQTANLGAVEPEHRGHGSDTVGHCLLHELSPFAHQVQGILER